MERYVDSTAAAEAEVAVIERVRLILLLSQAYFFFTLALCLVLYHAAIVENEGISFYGVYHVTLPFLVVGFLVAFAGLWRSAAYLERTSAPTLVPAAMRALAVGLFVLLATPFNEGTYLNWAHMIAGVTLALIQAAITITLLTRWRSFGSVTASSVQLLGGVIAAASLPDWHFEYLLQGETIYQIGFAWCMIEWTNALKERRFAS